MRLDKGTVGICLVGIVGRGRLYTDLQPEAQERRPQHPVGTGKGGSFPSGIVAGEVGHVGSGVWQDVGGMAAGLRGR